MPDRKPTRGRAASSHGQRTTVRIPPELGAAVDRLADELRTSRNDALLRLAERGAALYRQELEIAKLREQRWLGVLASYDDVDEDDLPSADETHEAIMRARYELDDPPSE